MRTSTFQVRTYHRLPVSCTVYYSNGEVHGTGNVWNLSLDGYRIDGNVSVRQGMRFELLVMLPGKRAAIIVQAAEVAWTRGREFGLRLQKLRRKEAVCLQTFITNQISETVS